MILIDYNQFFLSHIFSQKFSNDENIDENIILECVLNGILFLKKKFKKEYGDIVLCADGRNYWRRKVFPFYKENRKKNRERYGINWNQILLLLEKIRNEIKDNCPFISLYHENAEADDIISILVKKYNTIEKMLIISTDRDFLQLQIYPNVKQYSSIKDEYLTVLNPKIFLCEKILRGDSGDGIPNFLSDDNTFVVPEKRQKRLTEKKLNIYLEKNILEYDNNLLKNYKRNQQLIDLLNFIPEYVSNDILNMYDKCQLNKNTVNKILPFLIKNKLKALINFITEF